MRFATIAENVRRHARLVAANENLAKVLAAKGYHYQFVFAKNVGHGSAREDADAPRSTQMALEVTRGAKCEVRNAIM